MKKIMITGSSGYVGKNLIAYLQKSNEYLIHGLDINDSSKSLCDEFFQIDILNVDDMRTIPYSYDAVIHLAAKISVPESIEKKIHYYENNCIGTYNVLNCLSFNKIIFASSGGITNVSCIDSSPYITSKKVCEDIVTNFCSSIPHDILRFSNIIGSLGAFPEPNDGLLFALTQIKKSGEISVFGTDYNTKDGTAIRDYVHIDDICRCIEYTMNNPSNSIHNLGNGIGYTVLEIIKAYIDNNKLEDIIIHQLPRRAGDVEQHIMPNISPLMKLAKYTTPLDLTREIKS